MPCRSWWCGEARFCPCRRDCFVSLLSGRGVAQPGIARLVWDQEVVGSNPTAPTLKFPSRWSGTMWWLLSALTALLVGCSQSTEPEYTAERITLNTLRTTPGFAWFDAEMQSYQPDSAVVALIRQAYRPGEHHFYVYVKPTCSCYGTQKLFPRFCRVLLDAGVAESDLEIYSMHGSTDKHPHMHWLHVQQLPSFFIARQQQLLGSIAGELPADKSIEQVVLEILRSP